MWLVLRWGGVAYLTFLGLRALAAVVHVRRAAAAPSYAVERGAWDSATSGYLTNFLNPSLTAFYLIVVPQFIPRGEPYVRSALGLTAIHVAMAFSWHLAWALAGSTLARVLSRGRPRQVLDAVTGVTLLLLAARLAGVL